MKHRPAAFLIVLDELDIDGFGHVVDAIPCDVRRSCDLLSFHEFHVGVAFPEVATHRVGVSPGHNPAELALGRSARIVGGGERIRKAEFRMLFNTVFFVRTVPYLVRISTGKEPVIRNVSFFVKYAIFVKTANALDCASLDGSLLAVQIEFQLGFAFWQDDHIRRIRLRKLAVTDISHRGLPPVVHLLDLFQRVEVGIDGSPVGQGNWQHRCHRDANFELAVVIDFIDFDFIGDAECFRSCVSAVNSRTELAVIGFCDCNSTETTPYKGRLQFKPRCST